MVLYRSTIFFITCASYLGFLPSFALGLDRPNPTEEHGLTSSVHQVKLQNRPAQTTPVLTEKEDSTLVSIVLISKSAGIHGELIAAKTQLFNLQESPQPIIQTPVTPSTPAPTPKRSLLAGKGGWIVFGAGIIVVVTLAGGLFYLLMRPEEDLQPPESGNSDPPPNTSDHRPPPSDSPENAGQVTPQDYDINGQWNLTQRKDKETTSNIPPNSLVVGETARLKKIDIIDELVQELQAPDPSKRRKTIWELGQRGDSRAIQPLVNLMIDSDSKQRSLILAALSEIGTRTLQPMNRALVISLQDENAEVRKNAIRDLTRIYDLVAQMSQILRHAVDDSDAEVQETARWALGQLNHIRNMALPSTDKPSPDNSVEDSSRNS